MVKTLKLATLLMAVLMLQSCLNNDDNFHPVVIGTAKVIDNDPNSVYFILDTGYKLLPNNIEDISRNDIEDNQRVFLQIKDVEEDESKKEIHGTIIMWVKIKTQAVEFTESVTTGNELMKNSDPYVVNGFLTLKCHYKGTQLNDSHKFNLYALKDAESDKDGHFQLYLTHDATEDNEGSVNTVFLSFPVDNIQDEIDSHKSTVISFKTYYSGYENYTVYIKKQK